MTHDLHCRDIEVPLRTPFKAGSVWLVGAGPGDPGLLTLLGLDAVQQADVILYDALVNEDILRYASACASLEFVGKRGGQPSPSQASINSRLVEHARASKRVLRLKGGDPFVFGRGSEEVTALLAASVPFRVVPGVTAGIGGLAYAGIPLTARDTNHGVILATGFNAPDSGALLNWGALARTGLPVVLYMAVSSIKAISQAMIEGGRAADTPVAVISNATTEQQRVLVTTLLDVHADVSRNDITAPAIIAIGDIVSFRASMINVMPMVGHE